MALPVTTGTVNKSSDICSKGYYLLWTLVLLQLLTCVSGLFEDQIGKFDWRQQFIGKLKYATIDAVSNTRKVFVATEQNVIAALNPKTGQILWRQVLENDNNGHIRYLCAGPKEVITISGGPLVVVQFWNSNTGLFQNSWVLNEEVSTNAQWTIKDENLYHVVPVESSHVEISKFNSLNGEDIQVKKIPATFLQSDHSCILANLDYVCMTKDSLYTINIKTGLDWTKYKLSELGIATSYPIVEHIGENYVTVAINDGSKQVIALTLSGPKLSVKLPHSASSKFVLIDSKPSIVSLLPKSENELEKIININLETSEETSNEVDLSTENTNFELSSVMCTSEMCRFLLSGDDDSIIFLQQPGKILWKREEALSSILNVEIMDLPVSDIQAAIEKEFDLKEAGIVAMFLRRLYSQYLQIESLLSSLSTPRNLIKQNTGLVRDVFGLHKIIIAVTSSGKVFGVDNLSGNILWKFFIHDVVPFQVLDKKQFQLYVLRTTSHVPFTPQCALLARHKTDGKGVVVVFNPITGEINNKVKLENDIKQSLQLPNPDQEFLKGIVIVDENLNIHVFPKTNFEQVLADKDSLYLFTADPKTGEIVGYSFGFSTKQGLSCNKVWEMKIPSKETILVISGKNPHERVHSQGRVLADRSVLYKYVNPNLIAILTHSNDPVQKDILNIYLVDAVSGAVIFSANHKRAKGPVNIVHSENWIVYSYFNERLRRTELASLELYEGRTQSNSSAFSSITDRLQPIVERQAYILPSVLNTMRETITEKGITSKHILMALSSGHILELPWMFVDPRRPVVISGEMREEGVIPYVPELPIPHDALINYNQTVFNVRGIHTAPSGLESTCIVLVYGLDLFYTRVAPSKTFDLLKDDFDHSLITLVLLGLIISSVICKKIAARKALKQAWK